MLFSSTELVAEILFFSDGSLDKRMCLQAGLENGIT